MARGLKLGVLGMVLSGAGLMSGCMALPCGPYPQTTMMSCGGGAAPCGAVESCGPCQQTACEPCQQTVACDPCQGNTFSPGYGYYGGGQPIRTGVTCVEGGVNAAGNLIAGVVTFPFHLAGNLAQSMTMGAGYYGGCAGGGCSREVYSGDYGYQPQDYCDPCAGQNRIVRSGAVYGNGNGDCGCSGGGGGVPASSSIPSRDEVIVDGMSSMQRPTSRVITASAYQSNLAPTHRVVQASFATPTLRPLPTR
ncbi:MAG: hypothetical protein ACRC46_07785 [Thermoguttaceae bacterium]